MILELIIGRGMAVQINGRQPQGEWQTGDDGKVEQDGGPLIIGDYRVHAIKVHGKTEDWQDEDEYPNHVTIWYDGAPANGHKLYVTAVVPGPNGHEAFMPRVTTGDGVHRLIDETQLYIRAEEIRRWSNAYHVSSEYGGPEEGGWWYDEGEFIAGVETTGCNDALRDELEAELRKQHGYTSQYPRTSVLGTRDFEIRRQQHPGRNYPSKRPHYE